MRTLYEKGKKAEKGKVGIEWMYNIHRYLRIFRCRYRGILVYSIPNVRR